MKSVNPYLNFEGNTEEAFDFYKSVFGGEFSAFIRFRDFGDNGMGVADEDLDKLAHVALPLGAGTTLMGTDAVGSMGGKFVAGNNISVNLEPGSAAEAEALFAGLSAGGRVEMPLTETEWAEKYGSCTDRFGVQWMVNYPGKVVYGAG